MSASMRPFFIALAKAKPGDKVTCTVDFDMSLELDGTTNWLLRQELVTKDMELHGDQLHVVRGTHPATKYVVHTNGGSFE